MLVSAVSRNKWAIFVLGDPGRPRPGLPARERPPAASARPPGAAALLLYSDTPLFCDCSTQQGPRGPPPAPGGPGGSGEGRGGEVGAGASREAGRQDPLLARSSCQTQPKPTGAPVLCRARESTTGNKTAHGRRRRDVHSLPVIWGWCLKRNTCL